jgi:tol-pal system protein YbgF
MQGQIETLQHRNDELKEQLDRQAKDSDFRLKALEDKQLAAAPSAMPAPGAPAGEQIAGETPVPPGVAAAAAPAPAPAAPAPAATPKTPREQYNAAFRLLNQAQYEQAGTAFEAFVKQNPRDPLVGNAYYWLGETWYVRGNYTKAADYFRQGFEAAPKGTKAADNLLKLGMSLSQMQRTKEACVVFKQIGVKYSASNAAHKAQDEATRLNCP